MRRCWCCGVFSSSAWLVVSRDFAWAGLDSSKKERRISEFLRMILLLLYAYSRCGQELFLKRWNCWAPYLMVAANRQALQYHICSPYDECCGSTTPMATGTMSRMTPLSLLFADIRSCPSFARPGKRASPSNDRITGAHRRVTTRNGFGGYVERQ